MDKVDVLIVGGGPVGLTLAIDLARRGIRCKLIERRAEALFVPKMELCNPRTMEFFRRLGVASEVRRRGYDADRPMDIIITTSMQDEPILHLEYPSSARAAEQIAATDDGSTAREPYARISQYTLEPLLREHAENEALADICFEVDFVDFEENDSGLIASVREADGTVRQIQCAYLVGCDGASSTVRQKLGIQLDSFGEGPPLKHLFFESSEFPAAHTQPLARHYYLANTQGGSIVTQDHADFYGVHAAAATVETLEPQEIVDEFLGAHAAMTLHHAGSWTPRLLVAQSYGKGRVLLAGDAAHQFIPTGGFGLNTGIVDVINLGWKLSASLHGWGGPGLIPSYLEEQHRIGIRNCGASKEAAEGHGMWRQQVGPAIRHDAAMRERVRQAANVGQRKSHEMNGVELGYGHYGSPIVAAMDGETPDPVARKYVPSTAPGAHLPHFWLEAGVSIYDRLGSGFALIVADSATGAEVGHALAQAYAEHGAPFTVIPVPDRARAILRRRYVLVRPDLHVVWRGDDEPSAALAGRSLGFGS